MRRQLPLIPSSSLGARVEARVPSPEQGGGAPRAATQRRRVDAIGIADTGSGQQAAGFARALAIALASRGQRPMGTLLAFTIPPRPDPELAGAFANGTLALRAIEPDADGDALPDLSVPDGAIALLIGPPALASYDPTLAILLGTDRPLARWPAALRTHRAHYQLALGPDRPGIALALAALVRGPRVLPGR